MMEVDILEFKVPVENNKTLFIWDIQPSHTETEVYGELYRVFSSYGPLYLLKVCPNAPLNPPGFYALIKFYSAAQASKAQQQTDGQLLFQSSPLKVRLSSKQTPHFLSDTSRSLSHARCLELANHCLGFNGWTSDIIALKELTSEEEEGEEEEGGGRWRRLRFGCLLQLSFPHHGQVTRAAAVVEDSFTCTVLHRAGAAEKIRQYEVYLLAPPEGGDMPSHELTELQLLAERQNQSQSNQQPPDHVKHLYLTGCK